MSASVRRGVATLTCRVRLRKDIQRNQNHPWEEQPTARVPRVARLLALAHKIDGMIRSEELKDWAEAAWLIGITRARMTQLASLLLLAPEIQENILSCSSAPQKADTTTERNLRKLTSGMDWQKQKSEWAVLESSPSRKRRTAREVRTVTSRSRPTAPLGRRRDRISHTLLIANLSEATKLMAEIERHAESVTALEKQARVPREACVRPCPRDPDREPGATRGGGR